jgi:hypothetical protein
MTLSSARTCIVAGSAQVCFRMVMGEKKSVSFLRGRMVAETLDIPDSLDYI